MWAKTSGKPSSMLIEPGRPAPARPPRLQSRMPCPKAKMPRFPAKNRRVVNQPPWKRRGKAVRLFSHPSPRGPILPEGWYLIYVGLGEGGTTMRSLFSVVRSPASEPNRVTENREPETALFHRPSFFFHSLF